MTVMHYTCTIRYCMGSPIICHHVLVVLLIETGHTQFKGQRFCHTSSPGGKKGGSRFPVAVATAVATATVAATVSYISLHLRDSHSASTSFNVISSLAEFAD